MDVSANPGKNTFVRNYIIIGEAKDLWWSLVQGNFLFQMLIFSRSGLGEKIMPIATSPWNHR